MWYQNMKIKLVVLGILLILQIGMERDLKLSLC
ncbi:hypothetical protein OIU78_007623 [Salix suchowensis]|nr:hypothetical protein OIU78_007623 [Salix suchowensis]